jgi:hypothetical protein
LEPEAGPLVWAEPNDMMPCLDSGTVRIDGRPLQAGQPVPVGRPLVVQWRMNDCWPLGTAVMGLSGTLEMVLLHQRSQLAVHVRPRGLVVEANGMRAPAWREFDATVSLASATWRP